MKQFNKLMNRTILTVPCILLCLIMSCKKQDDWLNVKNTKSDVTPQTLQDFQAVLDNDIVFNAQGSILGLVGTDNLFITDTKLDAETQVSRNTYLWAKDIYQGGTSTDWYSGYQQIEYTNIVLDGLQKLSSSENATITAKGIQGQALFLRAFAYYQLTQLFCKPFIMTSAANDPGIPVKLSSDVNQKPGRGTVQQVYQRMISDLKSAIILLPPVTQYKTRTNANAATALLAKICLSMGDYVNAYNYADAALKINNTLLDYNKLNATSTLPFPTFAQGNPEVIWYSYCYGFVTTYCNAKVSSRISPDLYNSYIMGDLRKTTYFISDGAGNFRAKANYSSKANNFCGIANDEVYLIRSEAAARIGKIDVAQSDLNILLKNRLTPASYAAFSTTDNNALLAKILLERRKELAITGNMRWEDLRRLNQDSRFAVTLQRTYHGTQYTLQPNDNRYVFPLPSDEITIDQLPQNPR